MLLGLVGLAVSIEVKVPRLRSHYNVPATDWESQSLPIGNGKIGGGIFAGVASDTIVINEHTLWSGGPGAQASFNGGFQGSAADAHRHIQQLRQLLQDKMTAFTRDHAAYKDGNNVVAADYGDESGDIKNEINALMGDKSHFGAYQEIGSVTIEDTDAMTPGVEKIGGDCESSNPAENLAHLFDGAVATKWYADTGFKGLPCTIDWQFTSGVTFNQYRVASANDVPERDPKAWTLYASDDGNTYQQIDQQDGVTFASREQLLTYTLPNTMTHRYFRLQIRAMNGDPGAYSPQLSEVQIVPQGISGGAYTDYSRGLDLDDGVVTSSYTMDGVTYTREYFASYPHNVIAIRITSTGKVTKAIGWRTGQTSSTTDVTPERILFAGKPGDHTDDGLKFAAIIRVVTDGGTTAVSTGHIMVTDANSITIYVATATNYVQCQDDSFKFFSAVVPSTVVTELADAAVAAGYDAVKAKALDDYHALFDRTKLMLGEAITEPTKTTTDLLKGYSNGNSANDDAYLEMLYFQFGRYLMIGCSRKDSLPANLQGIWAQGQSPPWSSDYHTNINMQMNYFPALQLGLEDPHEAFVNYIRHLYPRGKLAAQHSYCKQDGGDARGWTIGHENSIWANTALGNYYQGFWAPGAAAWCCFDIWEHYRFLQDRDFLSANWDILRDAALFWVDTLWTDARDGTLVANPSYSPEHGSYSLGCACDQAIITEIFDEVLQAAEILGVTDDVAEVKAAKAKLSGPKIGLAGQFQEWKDETHIDITGDNGHRHQSHLVWLHPSNQIVAGRSDEENAYVEAMKVSLRTRGDDGTGWSRAWKANIWARLRDGDHAYVILNGLLKASTLDNLWDTHPPFQIDGNFGGSAAFGEMLLQSQSGVLELHPALPSKWATGSVHGLYTRGAFVVDMSWANGKLTRVEILSKKGVTCQIKYPGLGGFTLTGATKTTVDADQISFPTTAGETYVLTP